MPPDRRRPMLSMKTKKLSLLAAAVLACAQSASAIIVFGFGNNDATITTNPGSALPWDNVGAVRNTSGGGPQGSAVYLGNRWVLTANHVVAGASQSVTFDGVTNVAIDTLTPAVQLGSADLKLVRLAAEPAGVSPLAVDTRPIGSTLGNSVLVGWGTGRAAGELVGDTVVNWDMTFSSRARRWGTNATSALAPLEYSFGGFDYSYTSIATILGASTSTTEAALTVYDSGSALFQNISGTWTLVGVAVTVEIDGSSTFATDNPFLTRPPRGDANFFVPVGEYSGEINAVIPEPASVGLGLAGAAAAVVALRRRRSA